ncbi:MAG: hypothetical protein JNG84_14005 [Archangium sp.]|nr:hypothetical protein [Archangium sp.]
MVLSREARVMSGVTLLTVPTIVFGGLTVLAVVTQGAHGSPFAPPLTASQQALYRAGHAHAGVLLILSLVLQVLLDSAALSPTAKWVARVAAPSAAILLSGGFFGIAHLPALGVLLWLGAAALVTATVVAGVGLVKKSAA